MDFAGSCGHDVAVYYDADDTARSPACSSLGPTSDRGGGTEQLVRVRSMAPKGKSAVQSHVHLLLACRSVLS